MREQGSPGVVRRIYANLAHLLGGKAAAGLLSLAYMAIAARSLGPINYGVLVLIHGFAMTVGGIIEFPGWHAVVRYGAQARERGDPAGLARLLRFTGTVELLAGAIAILVAAMLAPIVGPRLGWPPAAIRFAIPYSLAILATVRSTPAGYLQLVGRFDLLGWHNLVAPTVRLAGAVLAAALGSGLKGFLLAWLLAALAEWAVMWVLGYLVAKGALRGTRLRGSIAGIRNDNPGIWRFMIAANADVTFSEFAGRIAPLVVGWVLGPAAAGLYAIAQRITVVIAQPAQILGQAAYAELANMVAGGTTGAALRGALVRCGGIALGASLPILLLLAMFGDRIVLLVAGKAFIGATSIMVWLAVARIILLIAPPASAALIALGQPGRSVAANLFASLALLPLLPLLVIQSGLEGAGHYAVLQALAASLLLVWFVAEQSRARDMTQLSHSA